jgi:hypothetical protein
MPNALDELYAQVTEAIRRSEQLAREGRVREAASAYDAVSLLEEQIAKILPAGDPEGALARQGVVTAALDADDFTRAIERARSYAREEGLSPEFKAEIDALRREAEEAFRDLVGKEGPMVADVRFQLVLKAA